MMTDGQRYYFGYVPVYSGATRSLYYDDAYNHYHCSTMSMAHSEPQRHSSRIPLPRHGESPDYALRPPADGRTYTKLEALDLSIDHGKATIIKLIPQGPYLPSTRSLYNYFPPTNEFFSDETIVSLLDNYGPFNSEKWTARVDQIARAKHGRDREYICSLFGGVPRRQLAVGPCNWVCFKGNKNSAPRAKPRARSMRRSLSASGLQALGGNSIADEQPTEHSRTRGRARGLRRSLSSNRLQIELQPLDTQVNSDECSIDRTTEIISRRSSQAPNQKRVPLGGDISNGIDRALARTKSQDSSRKRKPFGDLSNNIYGGDQARASLGKKKLGRQQDIHTTKTSYLAASGHIKCAVIDEIRKRPQNLPLSKEEMVLQELLNNAPNLRSSGYTSRDNEHSCADSAEPIQKRSRGTSQETHTTRPTAPSEAQPQEPHEDKKLDEICQMLRNNFDTSREWEQGSDVSYRQLVRDKHRFDRLAKAITNNNLCRCAAAIATWMKSDDLEAAKKVILDELLNVNDDVKKESKAADYVLQGVRKAVQHHSTKGSRTTDAQAFIYDIALVCVWHNGTASDATMSDREMAQQTGLPRAQISMARDRLDDIIAENSQVKAVQRKKNCNFICEKAEPFIYNWLKCEDGDPSPTRLDTNAKPKKVIDPNTGESVDEARRIWQINTQYQRFEAFLNSPYYAAFQDQYDNRTIGSTSFQKILDKVGTFVDNPRPESCVDEKVSQMVYYMDALCPELGFRLTEGRRTELDSVMLDEGELSRKELSKVLQSRSVYLLTDAFCCEKKERYELEYEDEDKGPISPKFTPISCSYGVDGDEERKCEGCKSKRKLSILDHLLSNEETASKKITVTEWCDAERQGVNKKGKKNKQREPRPTEITVSELVEKFRKQLELCIPHIANIRWLSFVRQKDLRSLKYNKHAIYIQTDFGSTMSLRAAQTKTGSVDDHAVIDNFVVYSNYRVKEVEGKKKVLYDVDVLHFIASTLTKGKKADHSTHNAALDKVIDIYKEKIPGLKLVIINTDNCPNQYRCRQNFIKIASIAERHPGIEIWHVLAVVDNFKGVHDGVSQHLQSRIRREELMGNRTPTAVDVAVNSIKWVEKEDCGWKALEEDGDPKILKKEISTMDSRKVYFVCETKDEMEELEILHPSLKDRLILNDRRYIMDTQGKKHIDGTTEIHEIRSIPQDESLRHSHPRKYNLWVANVPSRVKPGDEDKCMYAGFSKQRKVKMTVGCLSPKQANELIGRDVTYFVDKCPCNGKLVSYDEDSQEWDVVLKRNETDINMTMKYKEVCQAMQMYSHINRSS